jgi:hypothetical protein
VLACEIAGYRTMFATQIESGDYLRTPLIFLIAFKSFFRVSRLALFKNSRSISDNTESIVETKMPGSLAVRRVRYSAFRALIDASEYGESRCSGVSRARARLRKDRRICARPARVRPLLLPASFFLSRCTLTSSGGIQPACIAASCRASWTHDGGMPYGRKYSTKGVLACVFARDRLLGGAMLTCVIAIGPSVLRHRCSSPLFYGLACQSKTHPSPRLRPRKRRWDTGRKKALQFYGPN